MTSFWPEWTEQYEEIKPPQPCLSHWQPNLTDRFIKTIIEPLFAKPDK